MSLLLDALQKPEADLGLELPSLLEWRQVEDGKVDHVVLGRGRPGGIWQVGVVLMFEMFLLWSVWHRSLVMLSSIIGHRLVFSVFFW